MNMDLGAIITLCCFMVVHLCGTVWWMSKINTTLGFLAGQVSDIVKTVAAHEATYAKSTDVAKDVAYIEKQLEAMWKRIDQPHACPNGHNIPSKE